MKTAPCQVRIPAERRQHRAKHGGTSERGEDRVQVGNARRTRRVDLPRKQVTRSERVACFDFALDVFSTTHVLGTVAATDYAGYTISIWEPLALLLTSRNATI